MGRRGPDDVAWNDLKKRVDKRDGRTCRLLKCLSPGEYRQFLKINGSPTQVDHAHVFEVSSYPEVYTLDENVYCLCREAHRIMDAFKSPLTGSWISEKEHWYWWWRIINKSAIKYEELGDYENFVRKYVFDAAAKAATNFSEEPGEEDVSI